MSVYIVGLGMGNYGTLTGEAKEAILGAEIVIGAERLLAALPEDYSGRCFAAVDPVEIIRLIEMNAPTRSTCILLSGDTGFYSGTKRLLPFLESYKVTVLPGISSVQYFAAKLKRPWQDWKLVSAHGRSCDAAGLVQRNAETFFLTGGAWTVPALCGQLSQAGLGDCTVTVGENLGSDCERIRVGTVFELAQSDTGVLAVMLVENPSPRRMVSYGLPDDVFLRGGSPMTKSEVRSIVLSKLRLSEGDIIYDVGAGTGSVSVEAALLVGSGHVYAIECRSEACSLIKENAKKFALSNLTCIEGRAPEAFAGLPVPDAVFIGGSGGRLAVILEKLLQINPYIRLVLTAITLETLTAVTTALTDLPSRNMEIVQIAVNRAKHLGKHHLLTAQNPVFIISS
ncbi:MAG: precorrin-6y C5,15-methyltransferase (decarboxylating) subunit CbiE [Firmicutes bacterium]|nr:precorrin-6y C5,15-methyltransferase (decarboxylating) subunit CbiE [Bacillota bacterium]